jgi:hypothetical protein
VALLSGDEVETERAHQRADEIEPSLALLEAFEGALDALGRALDVAGVGE